MSGDETEVFAGRGSIIVRAEGDRLVLRVQTTAEGHYAEVRMSAGAGLRLMTDLAHELRKVQS